MKADELDGVANEIESEALPVSSPDVESHPVRTSETLRRRMRRKEEGYRKRRTSLCRVMDLRCL
jgi:hypothetical protein